MSKRDRRLLRPAEYARHRGVTRAAVAKALKSNRITADQDGLIDPVAADAQWAANTDAVQAHAIVEAAIFEALEELSRDGAPPPLQA